MSLPRLDHNGTFSLFDLSHLRDQFDTWGEGDTGDCASQMSRCSGNGMAISETRTRPAKHDAVVLRFENLWG
jgi:hypothetical protein